MWKENSTADDLGGTFLDSTQEQLDNLSKTTMGKAYLSFWKKWSDFSGKSTVGDYWWAMLANIISLVILMILTTILSIIGLGIIGLILYVVFCLGIVVPSLALLVRRIRDTELGWLYVVVGLLSGGGLLLTILPTKSGD